MRSLIAALLLTCVAGCGSPTKCVRVEAPPPPASKAEMVATGMPSPGTYRMLIVVDARTPPESFYGLYYGAVAMGWRVTVAGPADGPLPAQTPVSEAKPGDHDVLVLASNVPVDALAPYFAHAALIGSADHLLATLATGLSPHDPPRPTTRIIARTPGEIPAVLHRLQSVAEDQLRVWHRATGGHPP